MRYQNGNDVWEIERAGNTLVIREPGAAARTTRKFTGPEAADRMMARLVEERLAQGYTLLEEPPPKAAVVDEPVEPVVHRSAELEQAIAADPFDPAPYLVYADWLQARGDPRGEMIALMSKGVEVKALLKQHHRALLPIARRTLPRLDKPPFIWRYGFIHRIEIDRDAVKFAEDIGPTLRTVLGHPSGALVAEIVLRANDRADMTDCLGAIASAAPPLRTLDIAEHGPLGDLTRVLAAFPRLQRLSVKHRQRARRATEGLAPVVLRSVAACVPDTIERIELRCGRGTAFDDLAPLFGRTLPALTHLRVRDGDFADRVIDAVAKAPFAKQLSVLDLGMSMISEGAAANLARAGLALTELWTTSADLSPVTNRLLEPIAKHRVELSREPVDVAYSEAMKARYRSGGE